MAQSAGPLANEQGPGFQPKANLTAAVPPAAGNDSTQGYAKNSLWIDTVGVRAYVCLSATAAAAVWHKISTTTGVPGATGVATASAEGVATTLARSDHAHQSNTAPTNTTKAAAVIGTSGQPARADHKHDIATAAPGATGVATASGEGASTSLARADHTHQSNTAPANTTKAAAAIGTSDQPARADHKHDVATAAPSQGIGGSNAEGASTSLARADHNHTIRETAGATDLTVGAILDGQRLLRLGTVLRGASEVYGATVGRTSTTGSTWLNAQLVTKTAAMPAGTYELSWHYYWDYGSENTNFTAAIYQDGIDIGPQLWFHRQEPKEIGATQRHMVSGFLRVALDAAAHTFNIAFASEGGAEAGIGGRVLKLTLVGP